MLLQFPVGKLSDVIERRLVLIGVASFIVLTVILTKLFYHSQPMFLLFTVILGGLTFTIYPVSISHACDALDNKDVLAGTQSLLLAYSCGAIIGPFLAPMMMHLLGQRKKKEMKRYYNIATVVMCHWKMAMYNFKKDYYDKHKIDYKANKSTLGS